jgi:probable rRNA maturation factor
MEMATDKDQIVVDVKCCFGGVDTDINKLKKLVVQVCRRFSVDRATVSIAIVGDENIKKINSDYLKRQTNTDVISFDLSDEDENGKSFEIIINAELAMRQAEQRGHSSEAELALYLTHGLLHNLRFDDVDAEQAGRMHNMEDEILQQAGFGVVYKSQRRIN